MLLSWTGTIFEYLMPSLWMKTSPHTLLEQSMRNVVETQRLYFSANVRFGASPKARTRKWMRMEAINIGHLACPG